MTAIELVGTTWDVDIYIATIRVKDEDGTREYKRVCGTHGMRIAGHEIVGIGDNRLYIRNGHPDNVTVIGLGDTYEIN